MEKVHITVMTLALALACAASLHGCGQKGPLKVPEPAPAKPAPTQ